MGCSEEVGFAHRIWMAEPTALGPIRREVRRWLARVDLTADAVADLVLAVDEAAANVIDHAYREPGDPGLIELSSGPSRRRSRWRSSTAGGGGPRARTHAVGDWAST